MLIFHADVPVLFDSLVHTGLCFPIVNLFTAARDFVHGIFSFCSYRGVQCRLYAVRAQEARFDPQALEFSSEFFDA